MADFARPVSDADLVSTTVKVERKIFYLDLKENVQGRYLKISEKGSGVRSTVVVPAPDLAQFVELINMYASNEIGLDHERKLLKCFADPDSSQDEEEQGTKVAREFGFEVKENPRGRYLRIEEMRGGVGGQRSLLLVPEGEGGHPTGWGLFYSAVAEVVERFGLLDPHDPSSIASQPGLADGVAMSAGQSQNTVAAGNKTFFFDIGENSRGSYLKITEQVRKMNDRNTIVIPTEALSEFHAMFTKMMEQALPKESSVET
mmetsp:Transcript_22618/g.31524  ORF Transcript_22618/g.31524 Transcript_22618/m.31524 type:complete len:259 (+) Transcript_22618:140-916(+)|eukprot:CAMPEP_0196593536 /NCGR_PEP_ID=MMETSP1081-20130531/75934_1 /TAXON_ID=36882 /ORGANISM="Pyramimonas amylifera, Strain CCMP720" /LENGTH=258 /DNA_ID=CAMNT_0041917547 /DNA_START=140 /DNA_END=916 /DNA_ORIENTATION=-